MPWLLASLVFAHPTVDDHLHATEALAPCDDVGRLRRAAALADAARYDDALLEVDALCDPTSETARLARARLLHLGGAPAEALPLVAPLPGLDAAVLHADVLAALGRPDAAADVLATALLASPSPRPEHWLAADAWLVDDARAATLLAAGVEALGPLGPLVRALAAREARVGRLDAALARLSPTRVADRVLAGDLLAASGRHDEARAAWQGALTQLDAGRSTPAAHATRAELLARLETP